VTVGWTPFVPKDQEPQDPSCRIILCYTSGERHEYLSPHGQPSQVVLAHDHDREFWPTGEVRLDGAVFYKEGTRCEKCGLVYGVGESPACKDGHTRVASYHPFTHYFDFALGEEVTSLAQRRRLMRQNHLDYRDKMSAGDLSARRDRVHEEGKERGRD
jgi:hypothetical protein